MKTVEELEKENEQLKNRCYVLSQGFLCSHCPIDCKNRQMQFRGYEKESEEE